MLRLLSSTFRKTKTKDRKISFDRRGVAQLNRKGKTRSQVGNRELRIKKVIIENENTMKRIQVQTQAVLLRKSHQVKFRIEFALKEINEKEMVEKSFRIYSISLYMVHFLSLFMLLSLTLYLVGSLSSSVPPFHPHFLCISFWMSRPPCPYAWSETTQTECVHWNDLDYLSGLEMRSVGWIESFRFLCFT